MSIDRVAEVYRITGTFPASERYGLVQQMRRAAVSVVSNFAEGAARQTKKEFANFLHTAQGSLSELDAQFEIALVLEFTTQAGLTKVETLMERLDKMLTGLIKSLRVQGASGAARR